MIVKHITMTYERSTRSKYRYKEIVPEGGNAVIGTVYLRKDAFATWPMTISIDLAVIE